MQALKNKNVPLVKRDRHTVWLIPFDGGKQYNLPGCNLQDLTFDKKSRNEALILSIVRAVLLSFA